MADKQLNRTVEQINPLLDKIDTGVYTKAEIDEQEAVILEEVAKNTNALAELVDGTDKNKLKSNATTQTITGVTFAVNSDGTVSVSGSNTGSSAATFTYSSTALAQSIPLGDYILSGCPSGGGDQTYDLRWYNYSTEKSAYDRGSGAQVSRTDVGTGNVSIVIKAGVEIGETPIIFKPMICTKTEWNISQQYAPYRPSYQELYEMVLALQGNSLMSINREEVTENETE